MSIADITQLDVTNFATEFLTAKNVPILANVWTDLLLYVNQFDPTIAGAPDQDARMARIYLAAHMAKLELLARSGAAGPLTAESVGGVRRSYGLLASGGQDIFMSTRYGQLYLMVIGMAPGLGVMLV